jgi:hypothetical protein
MDKIRTPKIATLDIAGTPVDVYALTLGMVRRASQAEGTEEQLALVAEIVDSCARIPSEPDTRPSEVFGIDDCNAIVSAATGTAPKDADFPKP